MAGFAVGMPPMRPDGEQRRRPEELPAPPGMGPAAGEQTLRAYNPVAREPYLAGEQNTAGMGIRGIAAAKGIQDRMRQLRPPQPSAPPPRPQQQWAPPRQMSDRPMQPNRLMAQYGGAGMAGGYQPPAAPAPMTQGTPVSAGLYERQREQRPQAAPASVPQEPRPQPNNRNFGGLY